mgnify:CR=1 FL=1
MWAVVLMMFIDGKPADAKPTVFASVQTYQQCKDFAVILKQSNVKGDVYCVEKQ